MQAVMACFSPRLSAQVERSDGKERRQDSDKRLSREWGRISRLRGHHHESHLRVRHEFRLKGVFRDL
jgi:hypothetical protein